VVLEVVQRTHPIPEIAQMEPAIIKLALLKSQCIYSDDDQSLTPGFTHCRRLLGPTGMVGGVKIDLAP
jgi:hypothetical protein